LADYKPSGMNKASNSEAFSDEIGFISSEVKFTKFGSSEKHLISAWYFVS
jgi:hypothetical protein